MTDICPPATPAYPGIAFLRRAIRENTVSFPSQVPVLLKDFPSGMQWRTVLLYFVHGWSSSQIALRFRVPKHRIWKIVEQWAVRALNHGYLQVIDADAFTHCCNKCLQSRTKYYDETKWQMPLCPNPGGTTGTLDLGILATTASLTTDSQQKYQLLRPVPVPSLSQYS
jgi:hypothetical protein